MNSSRAGEMASAAQWLCGILCLISGLPVLYFDMLYAVAASYGGGMSEPLILIIVFSAMAYPAVAMAAVIFSALSFQSTRRFTWKIYLVPVAYLAIIAALIGLSGGAYL